jgi:ribose 5-phosphate isomerase A
VSAPKAAAGDDSRRKAGAVAAAEVADGMKLGLGSGRTAEYFVRALGERVKNEHLRVVGVPTSEQTAALARSLGIPLTTLEDTPELDLVIDGADEVGPGLRLIKGGGGALLREKIVASAARRMIVVADAAKVVPVLGAYPLPIEVIPFGISATHRAIDRMAAKLGLTIIDAAFGRIPDPDTLSAALKQIVGVVEHGLFIRLASSAIIADGDRVTTLSP